MTDDFMIRLDDELAKTIRFTSDRFTPASYLWKDGDRIMVSFVETTPQGAGYLRELFQSIEAAGYCVAVPTPFPRMEKILRDNGYQPMVEHDTRFCPVDMWMKPLKP